MIFVNVAIRNGHLRKASSIPARDEQHFMEIVLRRGWRLVRLFNDAEYEPPELDGDVVIDFVEDSPSAHDPHGCVG